MANYTCNDCGMMMDAVDEGQTEECPVCGKPMAVNTGSVLKNFGGAGMATLGAEMPKEEKP